VSATVRYSAAAVALVVLATLALWPFLGEASRRGVLTAGLIALPIQMVAFALLVRFRGRVNGFLAAWAGGMALRTLVVVATAVVVVRSGTASAIPMLIALAAFLFGLLLLEPLCFRNDLKGAAR
jgi:hypothetical protein